MAAFVVLKDGSVAISIGVFRQGIGRWQWETLTNVHIHITAGPGVYLDLPLRRIVVYYMGDAVTTAAIATYWCLDAYQFGSPHPP
jgi:hypothetical protein